MTTVTDALAARLPAGLIHPGNTNQPAQALPLPGLSSTGIPPDMAAHFADEAGLPGTDAPRLIAEAIVHLITTDLDCTIIANTDLADLRKTAADAPDSTRIITVHTVCDRRRANPLIELAVPKTSDRVIVPCSALTAILGRSAHCPHTRTAD